MRTTKLGAIAALCVTFASITASTTAGAQTTATTARALTFGIAGGAAFPTGDMADGTKTGFNAIGMMNVAPAALPVVLRFEINYNRFEVKKSVLQGTGADGANNRILGLLGNIVLPLPVRYSRVQPYAIAGAGMYNTKFGIVENSITASANENEFGYNVGGGVEFPLASGTAFIESRFHHVTLGRHLGNGSESFVPITLGFRF